MSGAREQRDVVRRFRETSSSDRQIAARSRTRSISRRASGAGVAVNDAHECLLEVIRDQKCLLALIDSLFLF